MNSLRIKLQLPVDDLYESAVEVEVYPVSGSEHNLYLSKNRTSIHSPVLDVDSDGKENGRRRFTVLLHKLFLFFFCLLERFRLYLEKTMILSGISLGAQVERLHSVVVFINLTFDVTDSHGN